MNRIRIALIALALGMPAVPAGARDYDPALEVDHSGFSALLQKYVEPDGVRYGAWAGDAEDRRALKEYIAVLEGAEPAALSRYQRLAYWLNVYNALTLDLVLDHYPLKSIKDIGSPWKRKLTTVEGVELSLNQIENDIVRKQWKEPRIHFALNCASVSCPPLRAEAYDGRTLHDQLREQTVAFLADEDMNYLDAKGTLRLSKIFQWYGEDFEQESMSVVDWVRPYIAELRAIPRSQKVKIKHGKYDWNLNEAAAE